MWIRLADASGAPGTEATAGTSVSSSHEYLPELRTYLPLETISRFTGLAPWVKNSKLPPGPKKACSVASSGTRVVPNVTSPNTLPTGLATDFFGHPLGPTFFSVVSLQAVLKSFWSSFTPLGSQTLTADSGGMPPDGFWGVMPY